ncbi:Asp23/Gls24 family envelope stress response protein [Corynebacterium tuberculostearicum]|uniref:Asp23/Gls24 family envelope stress response protein n=1 Tax=Corynebacterium tuberculostearicum TaxID=38304 RepID=UPI0025D7AB3E|nr:Asp23/Gls24 family envelope stress response protein [Corynebacterium tuberculostearicum]MDV2432397.1 Asp23/Gls24 family envelope stress response protein [Corynebacterium tuberculostearicum]WKE60182.1 Asp23/Gls24 family envelope stress response protein [Corynebacterium tuberculostearicum]
MSENKTPAQNTENQVPASEEREVNNNLETQYGTTTIDDVVVSKIAGIAAREVSGVDSLGGGGARMIGNIRESFGASEDVRQGVDVEVTEGTARIEIAISAEYGVAIHELAEAIRRNIMNAVERMTGLSVERVDVVVHDVKLPKEEAEAEDQTALNQGQA